MCGYAKRMFCGLIAAALSMLMTASTLAEAAPTETPNLFQMLLAPTATPVPEATSNLFNMLKDTITPVPTEGANIPAATPVPTEAFAVVRDTMSVLADLPGGEVKNGAVLVPGDALVAENGTFVLYLDEANLLIKVQDKRSGYIFASSPDIEQLTALNQEWRNMALSLVVVEYLNSSGTSSRAYCTASDADAPMIAYHPDGFSAKLHFPDAGVRLVLDVRLTDTGFTVSVPHDSINEDGSLYLNRLYILPFFGAVLGNSIPGYMLIPDGSGALIAFDKPASYLSAYTARVYGQDYGTRRPGAHGSLRWAGVTDLNMPLFGMAHGPDWAGFLALCEQGEAYMALEVAPAGVMTDFHRAGPVFIYREAYSQPTGQSSSSFLAIPPRTNVYDARMAYILLTGDDANYSGMAAAYRNRLMEEGVLARQQPRPVPLLLRILMSEIEKGVVGTSRLVMTSYLDAKKFVEALASFGVKRVDVALSGYAPGGVSAQKLGSFVSDAALGDEQSVHAFEEAVRAVDGVVYLEGNILSGYAPQVDRTALVYNIDGGLITLDQVDKPLYSRLSYQNLNFVTKILGRVPPGTAIALSDLGNQFHSDFKEGNPVTRDQAIARIRQVLAEAGGQTRIALHAPYAPAFVGMSAAMDVPMKNSQYSYQIQTVPFYQMVLAGCVDIFTTPMNYGTGTMREILQLIDYNVSPAFLVTQESAARLYNSNTTDVYSSRFVDWQEDMVRTYGIVAEAANAVRGACVISRRVPLDGVVRQAYDNSVVLYINYTSAVQEMDGISIPAESVVIRKEGQS